MTMKSQLRTALLCFGLGIGSIMGVPMRAEEIEELISIWRISRRSRKCCESRKRTTGE